MNRSPAYVSHDVPDLADQLSRFSSINELIDYWADQRPKRIALSGPSQGLGWRKVSWGALQDESIRLALGLITYGVRQGDHVGILADGTAYVDCVIAYMALLRVGAVMVPLNPRYADSELAHAIAFADCAAVIAQAQFASRIHGLKPGLPRLSTLISMGPGLPPADGWQPWPQLPASEVCRDNLVKVGLSDLANIVFTSGTTARPKAVMHSHASALATGAIFSAALGLTGSDVFHHAIPFFTSSGAQFALMPVLWVGATLLLEPKFDAPTILQRIEDEQSTAMIGVPSHYLFMLDELERQPRELPSMRLWDYGGASMPSQAIRKLALLFPHAEQRQNYGMTETGPSGALLTPDQTFGRIDSLGLPMPLCQIKIVDEAGGLLAREECGEIAIRSAACMLGYYKDLDLTGKTLIDGWVHTGDIGWMDNDGYLYYTDRIKDIINRGGLKISSIEVEDVLYTHPDVLEAAVIAIPHEKLGEDSMVFVVRKPSRDVQAAELQAFCAARLADYKAPRRFVFLTEFPKNAMGKIQKAGLRDMFASNQVAT